MTVWLCSDPDHPRTTSASPATDGETGGAAGSAPSEITELCAEHRQAVGHQLARHLISTCTTPGERVVEAFTASDAVLRAAVELDRNAVALVPHFPLAQHLGARLRARHRIEELTRVAMRSVRPDQMHLGLADQARNVSLVVAAPPAYEVGGRGPKMVGQHGCPACRADLWMLGRQQLTGFLAGAWEILKPGGVLATVTTARPQCDGRLHDPAPQVIARASRQGFVYVQHVIALRVPIEGDALAVQVHPGEVAQLHDIGSEAPPPRVSVHADVCLFVKPRHPDDGPGGQDDSGQGGGGR
ncbi:hypothetical protein [Actinomadura gamaensis]|uniref:Uncharacterized protein n=1 Tax=Actinomadura gamaensis TaxID=1763541 RepID=A0ABV9U771_9ACTN